MVKPLLTSRLQQFSLNMNVFAIGSLHQDVSQHLGEKMYCLANKGLNRNSATRRRWAQPAKKESAGLQRNFQALLLPLVLSPEYGQLQALASEGLF